MARFFKSIILFIGLFLVSCQEGREAGDLLGQWRMVGSDTKYISFSGSITWIRCLPDDEVFGNFQHIGDSLFIQCYSIEGNKRDLLRHHFLSRTPRIGKIPVGLGKILCRFAGFVVSLHRESTQRMSNR